MASPKANFQQIQLEQPQDAAPDNQPATQRLQETQAQKKAVVKLGFDCEFVQPPPEAIQYDCPVCLQIIRDPSQVKCCGKRFCRQCIQHLKSSKRPCPTCNTKKISFFPDKAFKQSLYTLKVQCSHQEYGCEWTGELRQLDVHLNTDPMPGNQLNGCLFAEIDCLYCEEKMRRKYIQVHQTKHCTKRPFSCEYCHNYKSSIDDVKHKHWPICGSHPVRCPNKCGSTLQRQNVDSHVADVCRLTIINCDFLHVGCLVKFPRKGMPEHLRKNHLTHMSLLATSHAKQQSQIAKQQAQISKQQAVITEQQDQIASLVAEINTLSVEADDKSETLSQRMQTEVTRLSEAHDHQEGQLSELKTALEHVRMTTLVAVVVALVAVLLTVKYNTHILVEYNTFINIAVLVALAAAVLFERCQYTHTHDP